MAKTLKALLSDAKVTNTKVVLNFWCAWVTIVFLNKIDNHEKYLRLFIIGDRRS